MNLPPGKSGGLSPLRIDSALSIWLRLPQALRALVPIGIMALLWWSSSCEPPPREPEMWRILGHNAMHGVAYAALAGSLMLAAIRSASLAAGCKVSIAATSLLVVIVYGLVDEVHQSFVPGRVCSVADFMADAFGAAAAVTLLRRRLNGSRSGSALSRICVVACMASVALATWPPW